VDGFEEPCRIDDDPYGLEQFFPLPEPPAYYCSTDSIIPEPEFHVYQDQADDLDEIIARISRLTKALKRRGVYDQSIKELSRLANAADNQFIAVENYQALATKGGLAAAFQTEDISIIAGVLVQLYQQRDSLVQSIWEIIGIADIMRGQSKASETLGAQQLKAQFGSQRLQRRQRTVQRWVRDLLKIKSEIIAEHFEPAVLEQITGEKLTPVPSPQAPPPPRPTGNPQQDQMAAQQYQQAQAQYQQAVQQWQQDEANKKQIIQILRTDKLRAYRIDVETDSTVFEDAEAEKQTRSALIGAVSQFITAWGPIVQQSPPLAPVAFELLKFGLGAFKSTRAIEDAIEQAAGVLEQKAQQQEAAGPPPSPEMIKAQAEAKQASDKQALETKKASDEAQLKQAQAAHDADMKEREFALKAQQHNHEKDMKAADLALRAQELQLKRDQAAHQAAVDVHTVKNDTALKNKEFKLKVMDAASKEHERVTQKGERDRAQSHVENQSAHQAILAERGEVRADKESAREDKRDAAVADVTKILPQVAEKLDQATKAAEKLAEASKPKRRIAIRDGEGNITETREEAI
jgi:hypothetical protein